MVTPRLLLPLVLPLAIATATPLAQPESPAGSEAPTETPEPTSGTGQAADTDEDSPPARNESPFVYRPSEEISEDLPVSFPVDI